eukprot:1966250-Pleurochrysis_carterae.AAC.1
MAREDRHQQPQQSIAVYCHFRLSPRGGLILFFPPAWHKEAPPQLGHAQSTWPPEEWHSL